MMLKQPRNDTNNTTALGVAEMSVDQNKSKGVLLAPSKSFWIGRRTTSPPSSSSVCCGDDRCVFEESKTPWLVACREKGPQAWRRRQERCCVVVEYVVKKRGWPSWSFCVRRGSCGGGTSRQPTRMNDPHGRRRVDDEEKMSGESILVLEVMSMTSWERTKTDGVLERGIISC